MVFLKHILHKFSTAFSFTNYAISTDIFIKMKFDIVLLTGYIIQQGVLHGVALMNIGLSCVKNTSKYRSAIQHVLDSFKINGLHGHHKIRSDKWVVQSRFKMLCIL